jgi:hypothetical protein
MRIVSELNVALTPVGKPVGVPIPVAPVVVCVMVVMALLIQMVGVDEATLVVLSGLTVIVPVADTVPQPPVSGIL